MASEPALHDCTVSVGLVDHLKELSTTPMRREADCRASCETALAQWDRDNYSVHCLWNGKVVMDRKITLLDVNWATCDVNGEATRRNRRDCVRTCADRLKAKNAPRTVTCSWDHASIEQKEIEASGGLQL